MLTGTLESLDVLGASGKLGNGLHESNSGLLISLEGGKDSAGHSSLLLIRRKLRMK